MNLFKIQFTDRIFIFYINNIITLSIFIKDILFENIKGHNLFVKL